MEQQIIINKRESVLLGAKLSFILILAALLIGLSFTIGLCFLLEDKGLFRGHSIFSLTYVSLIISVYLGVKGVSAVRAEGMRGNWNIKNGSLQFEYQAMFLLLSMVLYYLGILFVL